MSLALRTGMLFGCAATGCSMREARAAAAMHDAFDRLGMRDVLLKAACRMVEECYVQSDAGDHVNRFVLKQAAEAGTLSLAQREVAEMAHEVVGQLRKSANPLTEAFIAAGMAPEVGRALAMLAAGAGTVAGGGLWLANRGISEDDAASEALRAKTRLFRQVRDDMEERMRMRGPMSRTQFADAATKKLDEGEHYLSKQRDEERKQQGRLEFF